MVRSAVVDYRESVLSAGVLLCLAGGGETDRRSQLLLLEIRKGKRDEHYRSGCRCGHAKS